MVRERREKTVEARKLENILTNVNYVMDIKSDRLAMKSWKDA